MNEILFEIGLTLFLGCEENKNGFVSIQGIAKSGRKKKRSNNINNKKYLSFSLSFWKKRNCSFALSLTILIF
jgi:hypothetical protein